MAGVQCTITWWWTVLTRTAFSGGRSWRIPSLLWSLRRSRRFPQRRFSTSASPNFSWAGKKIFCGEWAALCCFQVFHNDTCVWLLVTVMGVWSVLCVACGSRPRTLAIKHSPNQQMHLKCTNKYRTVGNKQIHLKWGANPAVQEWGKYRQVR